MSAPYEITTDQDDIVIRVPRDLADEKALTRILDFLEMRAIREKSHLSEEEVQQLADEAKADAWKRVRHLFESANPE